MTKTYSSIEIDKNTPTLLTKTQQTLISSLIIYQTPIHTFPLDSWKNDDLVPQSNGTGNIISSHLRMWKCPIYYKKVTT